MKTKNKRVKETLLARNCLFRVRYGGNVYILSELLSIGRTFVSLLRPLYVTVHCLSVGCCGWFVQSIRGRIGGSDTKHDSALRGRP